MCKFSWLSTASASTLVSQNFPLLFFHLLEVSKISGQERSLDSTAWPKSRAYS